MRFLTVFSLAVVALAAVTLRADELSDGWRGLAGASLKEAVRRDCTPSSYLSSPLGEDGVWSAMLQADGGGDRFVNRFSDLPLMASVSPSQPPYDVYLMALANPEWWEASASCRELLFHDLYNLFPADEGVARFIGTSVPAHVDEVEEEYGWIRRGIGRHTEGERRCWQPSAGTEGDVARVIMYVASVYPDGIIPFGGPAHGYLDGTSYPTLTDAAVRQLLAWHRSDPVSELEKRRNEVFGRLQGNVNPFVANPELAEYLWGDLKGVPYQDGSVGDPDIDTVPLRARYSLSDSRINLSSPWVDSDAIWSVDGNVVTSGYVIPAQLGAGVHTLRFTGERESGMVLIEITMP